MRSRLPPRWFRFTLALLFLSVTTLTARPAGPADDPFAPPTWTTSTRDSLARPDDPRAKPEHQPILESASADDIHWDSHFSLPGPVAQDTDNRYVGVMLCVGTDVYVGGSFIGLADVRANGIARWDGSAWHALGSGLDAGATALLYHDGDLYVGGRFWTAGGVDALHVAKWDGTAWSALGNGIDFTDEPYFTFISSLAWFEGQLYAAGNTVVNHEGGTAPVIGKWDGSTWTPIEIPPPPSPFPVPPFVYGSIECMETHAGRLFLGGWVHFAFTLEPDTGILQWDGSVFSPVGEGLYGIVHDLAVFKDRLYAAGNLGQSGSTPLRDLAMWDGSAWSEVGGGIGAANNAEVYALDAHDGLLYVGGNFDLVGAVNSVDLAMWDGVQWLPYRGPRFGQSGFLRDVAVSDSHLNVAGYFTAVGEVITYGLARWDGVAWRPFCNTPQHGLNDEVRTVAPDGRGGIYAGGEFAYAGSTRAPGIAHFDGEKWSPLGDGLTGIQGPWKIVVDGDDVYVGGRFTKAGPVDASNLARWDGSAWHDVGGGVTGSAVFALLKEGNDLIVGGLFSQAGGVSAANVARWDGASWHAFGQGTNGMVFDLVRHDGALVAAGSFARRGGAVVDGVGRWDGMQWSLLGDGFDHDVLALAVFQGDLYAGGYFSHSGNLAMQGIARWDGTAWFDFGSGVSSIVRDLVVGNGSLFVCGNFGSVGPGPTPALRVARWDGSVWSPLGSGVGQWSANAMALVDDRLYVGGDFVYAGRKPSSCLARWNDAGLTVAVRVEPRTINAASQGRRVTAQIELPDDFAARDVDLASIRLNGRVTAGSMRIVAGRNALRADFDRNAVIEALAAAPLAEVTIEGRVASAYFRGRDHVKTVSVGAGENAPLAAVTWPRASLADCVPNPFNPATTIEYHVAAAGWVKLEIYDVSGHRVRRLVNRVQSPRPDGYRVEWDGRDDAGTAVASGFYLYRLVSPGFTATKKMLLLK